MANYLTLLRYFGMSQRWSHRLARRRSPQRDFAAVFLNGFDGSKSFISDRVEEKRRQSLAVRSAPAVIASTRSRRPNKEQPATEPAAVGTAKEGVSAAIKRLCETDHAGSIEHPAGFGAHQALRACAWPFTPPCRVSFGDPGAASFLTSLRLLPLEQDAPRAALALQRIGGSGALFSRRDQK